MASRPRSASPFSLDEDDDEDDDFGGGFGLDSRPGTSGAQSSLIISRPGSPLICASPLLLKFRPSSSPTFQPKVPRALTLMRKQKVYASKLRSQNRRLEQIVDDLEMLGVKAPRTGAPTRQLVSSSAGLKSKLGGLEVTCVCQEEEIFQLQRDFVTRRRHQETQVERDVFAGELARLQFVIKQLRRSKSKLMNENKEIARMRERNMLLEVSNERLAASIQAVQGSVIKAQEDMDASRKMAEDCVHEVVNINKMTDAINSRKAQLEKLIEKERAGREKLVSTLEEVVVVSRQMNSPASQSVMKRGS